MFLKNLTIFGGLVYVASCGAGRFSMDYCCCHSSCMKHDKNFKDSKNIKDPEDVNIARH
jgi:hypothetical protein